MQAQTVRISSGTMSRRSPELNNAVVLACSKNILLVVSCQRHSLLVLSTQYSIRITHHSSLFINHRCALWSLSRSRHSRNRICRAHLANHRIYGPLDVAEKGFGIDANPKSQDDEWGHVGPLPRAQVAQLLVFRIIYRAEKHSLIEPKHVAGIKNNSQRSHCGPNRIGFESAAQRKKL